ncbi:hypothetical protein EYC80_000957 [Monilinia laxa]|uniref:REJ domain-containing protein n=1 Tax=Monilinia laxa TaxID=61186 RepID=A0A5N6K7J9_MONLA|nr:hypothetical protein EYC80_000957 [Monilinia laxa]
MDVTSFMLLFFLVPASIFSVFAQVELPPNSSSIQGRAIPVITLTTNTILIVKVTAVFTETDVIIASPVVVVAFTKLSTSIDAAIASHIALVSSQSTESLPSSIAPSAPVDRTGTAHLTLITSDRAQTSSSSSSDPSILSDTTYTIDTTSITPGHDESYPSSSRIHLSTFSVPFKTTGETRSILISSHTAQGSSSRFSTNLPTTTPIIVETTSISSSSTQILPTTSLSYDLDSTTVKWITKSASLSPSTTTTTITYPQDGFGFYPSEIAENWNGNMAAHAIQSSTSGHTLQTSEISIIRTILEISTATVPTATVYVIASSSQNTSSTSNSKSLLDTARLSSSGFSSESSTIVTAKLIPASTFANNSVVPPSLTMSAQPLLSSSRLEISNSSATTTTSKLPYLNTTYLLSHFEQSLPASSLIRSSNNSSFLISHTTPIPPLLETKTSTDQTDTSILFDSGDQHYADILLFFHH